MSLLLSGLPSCCSYMQSPHPDVRGRNRRVAGLGALPLLLALLSFCATLSLVAAQYPEFVTPSPPAYALVETFPPGGVNRWTLSQSSMVQWNSGGAQPISGVQRHSQTYYRFNHRSTSTAYYYINQGNPGSMTQNYWNIFGTGYDIDSKGAWVRHGSFAMGAAAYMWGPRRCVQPLGVQSTQVATSQMGASSTKDVTRSVAYARLDVDHTSWTAAADDANPTLSIDLLQDFTINALSSQGAPDRREWPNTLRFRFRNESAPVDAWVSSWIYRANSDQNTTVTYTLPQEIQARYVQVQLLSWYGAPSARMEIYGRYLPGLTPVGLGTGTVAPQDVSVFSASSYHDGGYLPSKARLGGPESWLACAVLNNCNGVVGPSVPDPEPWLQIDFQTTYSLTGISTQERTGSNDRVLTYYLNTSSNGVDWTLFPSNDAPTLFNGNWLKGTATNMFAQPMITRYVRVVAVKSWSRAALRVEMYGNAVAQTLPGSFAWSDYSAQWTMRLSQRGYVGFSFRHQDQFNNYEMRMRIGQHHNLTRGIQNMNVYYQSVSGVAGSVVPAPNCNAHGYNTPGQCIIDDDPNTWVTMQYGYKPHLVIDLQGWYQLTSIKVINGIYPQSTLEVYTTDWDSTGEPQKQCGIGNYPVLANATLTLDCFNRSARYVYVGTVDFTTLSIREIELTGPEVSSRRMLLKREGGVYTLLASDDFEVKRNTNYLYTLTAINSSISVGVKTSTSAAVPYAPLFAVTDTSFPTGTLAPTWGEGGQGSWYNILMRFNTQDLQLNEPRTNQPLRSMQWSHYKLNLTELGGTWDALNIQTILPEGECCVNVYSKLNAPPHDYDSDFSFVSFDRYTTVIFPQPGANVVYIGVFNAHPTATANFTLVVNPVWATPIDAGQVLPLESLTARLQQNLYKLNPATSWTKLTVVIQPTGASTLQRDSIRVLHNVDQMAVEGQFSLAMLQGGSDGSGSYSIDIFNPSPANTWWWAVRILDVNATLANYTVTVLPPDPLLLSLDIALSPTVGGATAVATGSDLGQPGVLYVDGRAATIQSWLHNEITFLTPVGQGIGVPVNLTTHLAQRSNKLSVSYAAPTLTTISPSNAPTIGGTLIVLYGTNFGLTPVVTVSSSFYSTVFCPVISEDALHQQIVCRLQAGVGASASMQVTTPSGSSNTAAFNYDAPVLFSLSPTTGITDGGLDLTIRGVNFGPVPGPLPLQFDVQALTPSFWNDSLIIFPTPPFQGTLLTVRITVGGQGAASPQQFSYLPPFLTYLTPTTATTRGYADSGVELMLVGGNLGLNLNAGLSVSVGSEPCIVLRNNHTHLFCQLPVGDGQNLVVKVTVGSQQGTSTLLFSYLPPVLTSYSPATIATAGDELLTILGDHFGLAPSVSVGGLLCAVQTFNHTAVTCLTPPGMGVNKRVQLTANLQLSNQLLTNYTAPWITSVTPQLLATSGLVTVVLAGSNFGTSGAVTVGGATCTPIAGASNHVDNQIRCLLPAGVGANQSVSVIVATQKSNVVTYSYATPRITSFTPLLSFSEGTALLTINGASFGASGSTVMIDGQVCAPQTQSHSQLVCTVPSQLANRPGSQLSMEVNVAGQIIAWQNFSYAPPLVRTLLPVTSLTQGGGLLTIDGSSFTAMGNVTIGPSVCAIGAPGTFYSHTRIVCEIPAGSGTASSVRVTTELEGRVGNLVAFPYIAPSITAIIPNTPLPTGGAGGFLLTIFGASFGSSAVGAATIAGAPCPVGAPGTSYNATVIVCVLPPGVGTFQPLIVSVDGQSSSPFTVAFAAPQITSLSPANGPTLGGIPVTIFGFNLGNTQGTATFAGLLATTLSQNDSQIVATLPAASDGLKQVQVSVALQQSNILTFYYDGPIVTSVEPLNGPTQGWIRITLNGTNFLPSPHVRWNTIGAVHISDEDSQLIVWLPPGQGLNQPVRVSTQYDTSSSGISYFNYDPPRITSIEPPMALTAGGSRLTLYGENFGTLNTITIGGVACPPAGTGAQHNTSVCTLPVGAGANVSVVVTVSLQVSPPMQWSYAPPNVTSVSPLVGTTEGGVVVTLSGTSFGTDGSVFVGGRPCPVFNFKYTHKDIQCTLPEGQGTNQPVIVVVAGQISPQPFMFNYAPPAITSVTPLNGPTAGASPEGSTPVTVVIQGSNFGSSPADTFVTIGGVLCPFTGFGLSHIRIQCALPAGEGVDLPVVVHTSGQTSDATPVLFSYDPVILYSITPNHAPTQGGVNVTIEGKNFGLNPVVHINNVVCAIQTRTHERIVCLSPPGVGRNLLLKVIGVGASNANQTLPWSYDAPVIQSIEGDLCTNDLMLGTARDCPVTGNIRLTITGINFGASTSGPVVYVAREPCEENSITYDQEHFVLLCTVGAGVGINQPVDVTIQSQPTSRLLFSYSNPYVDANSLQLEDGLGPAIAVNNTVGGQVVHFSGGNFGSDITNVTVRYGPIGALWTDPTMYPCEPIDPNTFSASTISCTLAPGVGADLHVQVRVRLLLNVGILQTPTFFEQFSAPATDSISYPTPLIIPGSIALGGSATRNSEVQGTVTSGQDVDFDVWHIGTDSSLLEIVYGEPGGPYDQVCAAPQILEPDTRVRCRTSARVGVEGPYVFVVSANGAQSLPGNDTYSYPEAPSITSISGCSDDGVSTQDCPTTGGVHLVVTGKKFTAEFLTLNIGAWPCLNVSYINIGLLTCILPRGVGAGMPVVVATREKTSVPVTLLSYAAAVLHNITGCVDEPSSSVGALPGTRTTVDCPREGNHTVSITGTNLGSISPAIVFVSGAPCTNVRHDLVTPDTKLTCSLPAGTATQQSVLLVQGGGLLAANVIVMSYLQCPAGTSAPPGQLICSDCDLGSFTSVPGQYACSPCASGSYADEKGLSACKPCAAGFISQPTVLPGGVLVGAQNCTACSAGRFSADAGGSICAPCDAGTYNEVIDVSGGRAICLKCPVGRAAGVGASTSCTNCTAGSFAGTIGSVSCDPCAAGSSQPLPGQSKCTSCAVGTVQPLPSQTECAPCLEGFSQGATGQATCTPCSSGRFSNVTGLTACHLCEAGTVSVQSAGVGATECSQCTAGSYVGASGQAACISCDKGTASSINGATTCAACLPGTAALNIGSTQCTNCSAGWNAAGYGTVVCTQCPVGSITAQPGQATCSLCPAGYVNAVPGSTICTPCAPGSQISTGGQGVCIPCLSGFFASDPASTTCGACLAGSVSTYVSGLVGPTQCTPCTAGFISATNGQASCTPCGVGFFTASNSSSSCEACPLGTAQGSTGKSTCNNCTAGTIASTTGQFSCAACDIGSYQPAGRASSCLPCPAGSSQPMPGRSTCDACLPGKFSEVTGQGSCLECPAGSYSNTTGQSFCYQCAPGSSQPLQNQQECVPCEEGTFVEAQGQALCLDCPVGSSTDVTGSIRCDPCAAGKAATSPKSTVCTNCTAGYFSPAEGGSYCRPCEPGTATSLPGQLVCPPCGLGLEQPLGHQPICTPCAAGRFSGSLGATQCEDCPAGSASAATGVSSCPACLPGTFAGVQGMKVCSNCTLGHNTPSSGSVGCATCTPGSYAPIPGLATCLPCPAGRFQAGSMASDCTECFAGSAVAVPGQASCPLCPVGSFTPTAGFQTCSSCPGGTFSRPAVPGFGSVGCDPCAKGEANPAAGQGSCTPCAAGSYANETGFQTCTLCEPGTFNGATRQTICSACQLGRASNIYGALVCPQCGTGTHAGPTSGTLTCTPCLAGYAQPTQGQTSCVACLAGKITAGTGQPLCTDCPAGSVANGTANSVCTPCSPGFSQILPGKSSCVPCDAGSMAPSFSSPVCSQCDAGFVAPSTGTSQCAACDAGKFSVKRTAMPIDLGAIVCTDCPEGSAQSAQGQASCVPCLPGSFSKYTADENGTIPLLTACTPCDAGSAQGSSGQTECSSCLAGFYSSNPGAPACLPCLGGTFSALPGAHECEACQAGKFFATTQATECTPCQAGKFTDTTGQLSCVQCLPGTVNPDTGKSVCVDCPPGQFQDQSGEQICKPCPAGTYTSSSHTSLCSSCEPGRFGNTTGLQICNACPPGRAQSQNGQQECVECGPGEFQSSFGQKTCSPCPAGSFTNVNGTTQCEECAPGSSQPSTGSKQCVPCVKGTAQSLPGRSECIACTAGNFANTTGLQDCFECEPGTAQPSSNGWSCLPCDPGYATAQFGRATCPPCDVGHYADDFGFRDCKACPPGESQPGQGEDHCDACEEGKAQKFGGQAECEPCDAGQFANVTHMEQCLDCATGRFQPSGGESSCDLCPYGTYSISPGQASCLECAAGSVSSELGAPTCPQCTEGHYQPSTGKSACLECAPGFFQDSPGQTTCKYCKPGSFNVHNASVTCDLCPVGQYQNAPQSSFCDRCPTGTFSNINGTTLCAACEVGHYSNETASTSCKRCAVGHYQDLTYQSACKECHPGHHMNVEGAQICRPCAAGTATPRNGTVDCDSCQSGDYQPDSGQQICLPCPHGTYTSFGSNGATVCTPCDAGSFQAFEGEESCVPCREGKAQIYLGMWFCDECLPGRFSPVTGLSSCQSCEVGKYTAGTGKLNCTSCEAGKFQASLGQTTCVSCDLGQYNEVAGASKCLLCKPGQFSNTSNTQECGRCAPGSAQPSFGSTSCEVCEVGFFSATPSATTCRPCPAGTYAPHTNSTACTPCPLGQYQNGVGASECKDCQPGKFSSVLGADNCALCDSGTFTNLRAQANCTRCPAGEAQPSQGQVRCRPCEPGHASQPGQALCSPCPLGSASYKHGSSECVPCDAQQRSNFERTQCICIAEYFQPAGTKLYENQFTCDRCPIGADCLEDGTTESALSAQPGFWRASNQTLNFYRCKIAADCPGGPQQQVTLLNGNVVTCAAPCANGRDCTIPLCSQCPTGSRIGVDSQCTHCPDGASSYFVSFLIFLLFILVIWLQIYIILSSGKNLMKSMSEQVAADEANGVDLSLVDESVAGSQVGGSKGSINKGSEVNSGSSEDSDEDDDSHSSSSSETDGDEDGVAGAKTGPDSSDDEIDTVYSGAVLNNPGMTQMEIFGPPPPDADFTYQLKIFVTFLQILFTVGTGTNIILPSTYKEFLSYFDFLMFSSLASAATSSDCFEFIDYYAKYIMIVLTPVILLVLVALGFLLPHYLQCLCFKHSSSQQRMRSKMHFWKLFLYMLFLIYPAVSSTVLGHYVCYTIDDRSYILGDMRQPCYTDKWYQFAYIGMPLALLYPLGIPLFFFALLRINKAELNNVRIQTQLGFLYSGYHARVWFFELVDSTHKLFLCSIIPFFPRDATLPVGIAAAGLYMFVLLRADPYLRLNDDRLHLLAQSEIMLVLIAAHLFNSFGPRHVYSVQEDVIMSVALMAITLGVFVLFLGFAGRGIARMMHKSWVHWRGKKHHAEAKRVAAANKANAKLEQEAEEQVEGAQAPGTGLASMASGRAGLASSAKLPGAGLASARLAGGAGLASAAALRSQRGAGAKVASFEPEAEPENGSDSDSDAESASSASASSNSSSDSDGAAPPPASARPAPASARAPSKLPPLTPL